MDELRLCTAAFFRSKGKSVITEQEFLMGVSMNMRWMPYGDAEKLLAAMIKSGAVGKDGEYVRPKFDVNSIDVPVGYKPSADILKIKQPEDVFQTLVSKAAAAGIDKKDLLSYCRTIQKKLNVDIEVAALMALRDKGVDVSADAEKVYGMVKER